MSQALSAIASVRALLVADSTLVGLVPVDRMYPQQADEAATFPLIVYSALNEPDALFADNSAKWEQALVEIQVWHSVGQTPTTIARRVDTVMKAAGWSREAAIDGVYSNSQPYKILRYSSHIRYS